MLLDEDRKKLDGIVTQLASQDAPESDVHAIVDDFKKKYDKPAPAAPEQTSEPSWIDVPGKLKQTSEETGRKIKTEADLAATGKQSVPAGAAWSTAHMGSGLAEGIGNVLSPLVDNPISKAIIEGAGYVGSTTPKFNDKTPTQQPTHSPLIDNAISGTQDYLKQRPEVGNRVGSAINIAGMVAGGVEAPELKEAGGSILKSMKPDLDKTIEEGIAKGVKPTVVGKKTLARQDTFYDRAKDAVKTIAERRDKIPLVDDNGEAITYPKTNYQFAQAIDKAKKDVFDEYHSKAMAAGDAGARFDVAPTTEKLNKVAQKPDEVIGANDPRLSYPPDIRKYAYHLQNELKELNGADPKIIEDRIANLNKSLNGYYEGRTSADKAALDASVANSMRSQLDDMVTNATGAGYQDLKNKYGALKAIEGEVNHRAIVLARKATKGMADLTDIFTNGELIGGLITQNPVMIAKGVAGRATKEIIKYINKPDRFVEKMFKQAYDEVPTRGAATVDGGIEAAGLESPAYKRSNINPEAMNDAALKDIAMKERAVTQSDIARENNLARRKAQAEAGATATQLGNRGQATLTDEQLTNADKIASTQNDPTKLVTPSATARMTANRGKVEPIPTADQIATADELAAPKKGIIESDDARTKAIADADAKIEQMKQRDPAAYEAAKKAEKTALLLNNRGKFDLTDKQLQKIDEILYKSKKNFPEDLNPPSSELGATPPQPPEPPTGQPGPASAAGPAPEPPVTPPEPAVANVAKDLPKPVAESNISADQEIPNGKPAEQPTAEPAASEAAAAIPAKPADVGGNRELPEESGSPQEQLRKHEEAIAGLDQTHQRIEQEHKDAVEQLKASSALRQGVADKLNKLGVAPTSNVWKYLTGTKNRTAGGDLIKRPEQLNNILSDIAERSNKSRQFGDDAADPLAFAKFDKEDVVSPDDVMSLIQSGESRIAMDKKLKEIESKYQSQFASLDKEMTHRNKRIDEIAAQDEPWNHPDITQPSKPEPKFSTETGDLFAGTPAADTRTAEQKAVDAERKRVEDSKKVGAPKKLGPMFDGNEAQNTEQTNLLKTDKAKYGPAENYINTAPEITPESLVASKSRDEINSQLDKAFGGISEGRMSELDDGSKFKDKNEEIYYNLSNKYQADLERAANDRDIDEVKKLYDQFQKDYKAASSEVPASAGKAVRAKAGASADVSAGNLHPETALKRLEAKASNLQSQLEQEPDRVKKRKIEKRLNNIQSYLNSHSAKNITKQDFDSFMKGEQ